MANPALLDKKGGLDHPSVISTYKKKPQIQDNVGRVEFSPYGHLRKTDTSKIRTANQSPFDFVYILMRAATWKSRNLWITKCGHVASAKGTVLQ